MAHGLKPEVGHLLDERYLLERVIGEGGMGTVFAARHVELGELVAVKVLHASSAMNGEHLERFLREARLAAKIKNEHVVRVLDVARGRNATAPSLRSSRFAPCAPYIVMEYLDGFDLADLVRARGPLPPMEAVDYLLQACEAVVEAHVLGIVHRDLKPSNLFLTQRSDGTPLLKVLDFGISKAHDDDDSKLTTTAAVFGSPAYMSPEQIRSAKHVDHRSDVWGLAVVLFEVMTGRLPFVGESAVGILAAIAADLPLPLRHYAPAAAPGLQEVLEKCFVKDRDRRVSGVPELASMLAPYASAAGLLSVEAVRRIALQPRNSQLPLALSSGSLPPAHSSGALPPAGADVLEGINTTVRAPNVPLHIPHAAPVPYELRAAVRPEAVGRTDRGMVVASRRTMGQKQTGALFAVLAVVALGLAVGAPWVLRRANSTATSASPPPEAPAVAPPIDPPPTASALVVASAGSGAAAATGAPVAAPSSGRAHAKPHGHPSHPAAPAGSTAQPSVPPSPPPSPPVPNGHVDTSSRE